MSDTKSFDVDRTYGEDIKLDLKSGMAWALCSDEGPQGICGQDMRTTCPHMSLQIWPNEEAMREAMKGKVFRNGKDQRVLMGVIGDYTAGGRFQIIQHGVSDGE